METLEDGLAIQSVIVISGKDVLLKCISGLLEVESRVIYYITRTNHLNIKTFPSTLRIVVWGMGMQGHSISNTTPPTIVQP